MQQTTLAVVATDAPLTVEQANHLASVAHDGLARTIRPVHTMHDGDTVFALATGAAGGSGSLPSSVTRLAVFAVDASSARRSPRSATRPRSAACPRRPDGRRPRSTRPATPDDDALGGPRPADLVVALQPRPAPPPGTPFFGERTQPEDVLVAAAGGAVVGLRPDRRADVRRVEPPRASRSPASRSTPAAAGRASARALVDAAATRGRRPRRAAGLTLRVLGPNATARRGLRGGGFVVEGVLREEFHLDGRYVDDVLMARDLTPVRRSP